MSEAKYFQHIVDTPLRNFIEVAVNDNLSALTISGFPEQGELSAAWQQISHEFTDAIGSGESKVLMALNKEVTNLALDIDTINESIKVLSTIPDIPADFFDDYVRSVMRKFADELNRILAINFKFDFDDHTSLLEELKRCKNRSGAIIINHAIKDGQLKAMTKSDEKNEKPTKEYFIGILMTLSKGEGYKLTIDSETVFEFCERITRYNQQAEYQARNGGK